MTSLDLSDDLSDIASSDMGIFCCILPLVATVVSGTFSVVNNNMRIINKYTHEIFRHDRNNRIFSSKR